MLLDQQHVDTWSSLIVEAAPTAMLMVDRDLIIVLANHEAENVFGYARAELVGQPLTVLVPERFRDAHAAHIQTQAADATTTLGLELYAKRKDNSEVAIDLRLTTIDIPSGRFTLAAAVDLTERRFAAVASEKLASLVESSDDAIVSTSFDNTIMTWNAGAARLFGYSADEVVGESWHLIVPEDRFADEHLLVNRVRGGESIRNHEAVRRRKDGSLVDVSVTMSPIIDSYGLVLGVSAISRDITELRRSAELEVENRRVLEANRLKTEFITNMSHELRTPLNAIIGFTEILQMRQVDPSSPKHDIYLGYVLNSGRHLLRLINDVLDLAKVEAGKLDLLPEECDLASLVSEAVDGLSSIATQKKIQVSQDLDQRVGTVFIDPVRFKQVLYNYLSNALKFTPDGGRVLVRTVAEPDETFSVSVRDSGAGIAPDDLKRLFVQFQQLDSSTAKQHEGTGLGLALTKRLVECQGGRVGVDSRLGAGSTFYAVLPRRAFTS